MDEWIDGHLTYPSQRHLLTHSEENRFQCDICGRKVTTLFAMQLHMRIHSGIKPYTCEFCGKNFRLSSGLLVRFGKWKLIRWNCNSFLISYNRYTDESTPVSGPIRAPSACRNISSPDEATIVFTWPATTVLQIIFCGQCYWAWIHFYFIFIAGIDARVNVPKILEPVNEASQKWSRNCRASISIQYTIYLPFYCLFYCLYFIPVHVSYELASNEKEEEKLKENSRLYLGERFCFEQNMIRLGDYCLQLNRGRIKWTTNQSVFSCNEKCAG